jgi:hypothetical protein
MEQGPRAALRVGPRAALLVGSWAALRVGPLAVLRVGLRAAQRAGSLVALRAGPRPRAPGACSRSEPKAVRPGIGLGRLESVFNREI